MSITKIKEPYINNSNAKYYKLVNLSKTEQNRTGKKRSVNLYDNNKNLIKTIYFGNIKYEDFTIHKNEERRIRYIKRAGNIKDKQGNLTRNNPMSPNYYAMRYLWKYNPKKDDHLFK